MKPQTKILLIASITGVILILVLIAIAPSFVRVALSLPFLLFLPGYGITAILFPQRALDLPARLLVSVGLSLAAIAFSGLLLNLTPAGIRLQNPLTLLLIGGTGLLGLYFLVRDILNIDRTISFPRIGVNSRQVLFWVLAVTITAVAINIARSPASPQDLVGYTMLWVQDNNPSDGLKIGVRSEEFKTIGYRLHFEINGVLREGPTFKLEPGQLREFILELESDQLAGQPITLLLYRLDNPDQVYRRVVWWYEKH